MIFISDDNIDNPDRARSERDKIIAQLKKIGSDKHITEDDNNEPLSQYLKRIEEDKTDSHV
jgi:hypothetical protein